MTEYSLLDSYFGQLYIDMHMVTSLGLLQFLSTQISHTISCFLLGYNDLSL